MATTDVIQRLRQRAASMRAGEIETLTGPEVRALVDRINELERGERNAQVPPRAPVPDEDLSLWPNPKP